MIIVSPAAAQDGYEAGAGDNTSGTATPMALNSSQTHSIVPIGDVDWITFTLAQRSDVTIETFGTSGDTDLWLYDSPTHQIAHNDDKAAGDTFSLIRYQCSTGGLAAGTYYVKVNEYKNDAAIAEYTITLTATVCPLSVPTFVAEPTCTPGLSNTVAWSTVTGATGYYLEWDTESTFTDPLNSGWIATTSFTANDLANGQTYYYRVKAHDATSESAWSNIVSSTQDTQAPTGTVTINNNDQYTKQTSVTLTLSATDPTPCGSIKVRFKNGGGTWSSYENFSATRGWSLASGDGEKTVCVQFKDSAENTSGEYTDSIILDATAPTTPVVTDDGTYQTAADSIHAAWNSSDVTSGISAYQYAVGTAPTDPGSGYAVSWTTTGENEAAIPLILTLGQPCYVYVKARDCAGNWSAAGASNGIMAVAHPDISVANAKTYTDSETVGLASKTVTAILSDCFYVQDDDTRAGIMVKTGAIPAGLAAGMIVDIGGTLATNADEERYINGIAQIMEGTRDLKPLGMTNRSMGGGDSGVGTGQKGIDGASGINNIGSLVRIWGNLDIHGAGSMSSWSLDTNPGWTLNGQWAFGTPTGVGASYGLPDPTSGHTGTNVYGVNLAGAYTTTPVGSPLYLITSAIDCTGRTGCVLTYWRWLNTDTISYVPATVEVSNNGTDWTMVWQNGTTSITDSAWTKCSHSISAIADNQPTVYVRWGYQIAKSGARPYTGWNIDDIDITGAGDYTIDDGSGINIKLMYRNGVSSPTQEGFITINGISSCYKDGEGKLRRLLKVVQ